MKDDKQINLQTPYEIKSPTYTKKNLNINITDTGKGNTRRWQAPGGQRGQRANSAGRFRCGCPRKLLPSGKSAGRCGHRSLLFLFCLPDSLIGNTVQLALDKNKPAPTEVPVGAGFAASEQFHLFRYSRFTFSYACSLPRLPLPVQCLPE